MRKTVKDPAQGAVGKAEDVPDPSTAPSALPVSGGDYEYYEETAEYERNSRLWDNVRTHHFSHLFQHNGENGRGSRAGCSRKGGIRRKQRRLGDHVRCHHFSHMFQHNGKNG